MLVDAITTFSIGVIDSNYNPCTYIHHLPVPFTFTVPLCTINPPFASAPLLRTSLILLYSLPHAVGTALTCMPCLQLPSLMTAPIIHSLQLMPFSTDHPTQILGTACICTQLVPVALYPPLTFAPLILSLPVPFIHS